MSDFNWDDHPIIASNDDSSGFNWDDHPIVKAAEKANANDRGLVGAYQDAQNKVVEGLAKTHNPFFVAENMLLNTEPGRRAAGYAGGLARTGVATVAGQAGLEDWKKAAFGEAPSSEEYYARAGVPELGSVDVPFGKALVGHDAKITGRDALGYATDVLTDPVAHAMGKSAAPIAEGAAVKMGEAASDVAPWAAKKIGKVLANVPEETTGRYLEDPTAINSAPERKQIADKILDLKKTAEDKVVQAHDDLANAKGALADNKNDLRAGLQNEKFDLQNKAQEAQKAFDEKKQAFKEALKSNSLTSMAGEVHGAVGDLKDQVVQGSKDSYDILSRSNGAAETKPLINLLQNHIDSMTVNGVPASTSAEQAIREIEAMRERLKQMGPQVSMPQAKQILQGLDKDIQYNNRAGTFAPQSDKAFSDMRSTLDQNVKAQVPEYAAKMQDVARKAQLLSKTSDLYGTHEKAIGNLNGITSEKGQTLHAPMLEALGKETGRDLVSPVKGYILNDKILKTPSLFDQAIEEIPESKSLAKARADLASASDPAYARAKIESSNEPLSKRVGQAEAAVDAAKERRDLFSGVTPDSVTGKTKALNGANQYGAEIKFGGIDKAYGTNFEKEIQARNDMDQFKKTDTNGSRKTLLGMAIGGGLGYLIDHPLLGAELGGAAGASADKFAGQAFKAALDRGLSAAEIAKRFGPKAKEAMRAGAKVLTPALTETGIGSMSAVASNPKKGADKWANDGHSKLLEHADGTEDQKLIQKNREKLLANPKAKGLLIKASDLKPGTKAMSNVLERVKDKIKDGV